MEEVAWQLGLEGGRGLLREDCVAFFPAEGSAASSEGGKWKEINYVLSVYTEHRHLYQSIQAVRLILQMGGLRLREVKWAAKGHTAGNWQSQPDSASFSSKILFL